MSKNSPTNSELKIMLDYLTNTVDRIEKTGKDTNEKATYTNGRVTHLEEVQKQNHELLVKHDDLLFNKDYGMVPWKDRVFAMVKLVSISSSIIIGVLIVLFTLFVKDLKNQIINESSERILSVRDDIINESSEKTINLIEKRWSPNITK